MSEHFTFAIYESRPEPESDKTYTYFDRDFGPNLTNLRMTRLVGLFDTNGCVNYDCVGVFSADNSESSLNPTKEGYRIRGLTANEVMRGKGEKYCIKQLWSEGTL